MIILIEQIFITCLSQCGSAVPADSRTEKLFLMTSATQRNMSEWVSGRSWQRPPLFYTMVNAIFYREIILYFILRKWFMENVIILQQLQDFLPSLSIKITQGLCSRQRNSRNQSPVKAQAQHPWRTARKLPWLQITERDREKWDRRSKGLLEPRTDAAWRPQSGLCNGSL